VTEVRGHFKNARGNLVFDPDNPAASSLEAVIDAAGIWTGEPERDAHLRSADFLDVEKYPEITLKSERVEMTGASDAVVACRLTLRGVTRSIALKVHYLGEWPTPWWEDGVDKGPKTRAGFTATTSINRHDFGVSWNAALDRGGLVVGNIVSITLDAEAVMEE
jgi:polyisoprenoid-binding protein YceI